MGAYASSSVRLAGRCGCSHVSVRGSAPGPDPVGHRIYTQQIRSILNHVKIGAREEMQRSEEAFSGAFLRRQSLKTQVVTERYVIRSLHARPLPSFLYTQNPEMSYIHYRNAPH